jgi:hypothetical protein
MTVHFRGRNIWLRRVPGIVRLGSWPPSIRMGDFVLSWWKGPDRR